MQISCLEHLWLHHIQTTTFNQSLFTCTVNAATNKSFHDTSRLINSPADKCKIWPNCAFHDKSMKFGTKLEHILGNIFSYRAIADLSRDPRFLVTSSRAGLVIICAVYFIKDVKLEKILALYIVQTSWWVFLTRKIIYRLPWQPLFKKYPLF